MMRFLFRSLYFLAGYMVILCSGLSATAQQVAAGEKSLFSSPLNTVTEKTLSAEEVMRLVRAFHPIAKQASIQVQQAKAKLLAARGGFDPVLSQRLAEKTFDGTAYY